LRTKVISCAEKQAANQAQWAEPGFGQVLGAMHTSAKPTLIILLIALPRAWSQSSPSLATQPTIQEVAVGFTNYQQITKRAVFVNPELAMLCRGVSKAEVDAARVKFGPHANTGILIYMNRLAADSFATNAISFPVGAVIVKQKTIHGHMDKVGKRVREADTGVGGRVKRAVGYDPQHGDWEYFYFEEAGKIEQGRISTCVQCHSAAKDKDYVFGTWRKTGG
jgi:hypothetical protein